MRTRRELAQFVASLPIPKERRDVVQSELEDHVFESIAELEASGVAPADAERRSVESLGDPAELGKQLVDAQLAYAISRRQAVLLGLRTGAFVASVAVVSGYFEGNPGWATPLAERHVDWMEPSVLYYLVIALALLAAWPRSVIRPFLAAHRRAIVAKEAGNDGAVRRLQDPISSFFGALIVSSSAPFLFWIFAVAVGIPVWPFEGALLRTILASFVVNMMTTAVATSLIVLSSIGTRDRGRLA